MKTEKPTVSYGLLCLLAVCLCVWMCECVCASIHCVCVCVCVLIQTAVAPQKVSMVQKVKNMVLHFYHGFRLLALDTRVAARLLWKTMKGSSLTRRELKQVCVYVHTCVCVCVCVCVCMLS